ncbi:MAG: penicillin-binding protein activator LpoB [Azoarcus sp.]|jgi:curli biogenesis system outer membrane secretion channel CsgG|nr:penicillin-binding protein activator LpoB [Azoarcus sp.]
MTNVLKSLLMGSALAVSALAMPLAHAEVKVAVTDLAYEEKVQEYFKEIKASSKDSLNASVRENASSRHYSGSASVKARSESSFSYSEGVYTYIERGELRKFTSDIKGEMLKSGFFRIVQGKPYTAKNTEKLYDIISRIKKGQYPGADYVLFGTVSSIEFRQEANPIDNTDTVSCSLSLELVADFSLINTKTFEVKAAFSAMGEGQDTKMISSRGARVVLNRGKVVSEVSKSLGEEVIRQLEEQLASLEGYAPPVKADVVEERKQKDTEVIRFR